MQLHLKSINDELAKRGYKAVLVKGDGYFYFERGEAQDWLDRTVKARTVNSLTLKQWVEEFERLKELNAQILRTARGGAKPKRRP